MKKILNLFAALAFLGLATSATAQSNGTARGKVVDATTGETLLGATIRFVQQGAVKGGAYSDLEGAYSVSIPAGSYQVIVSYISYGDDTVDISIEEGKVLFTDHLLAEETSTIEGVDIVGKRSQASEVTLYNVKRTSVNSVDGISLDAISRTGDSDVGAAMQRVTGVTVEGGKYVYVRGLGDRYSKTLLNGAELPGLDPNRNSVQMDIFPSNLIDNILVYKNFTPDLPGSFTGGLIDVITKDFPDRLNLKVSLSTSFNPQANLRDDILSYQTGSTDWRATDDGTRAIPQYIQDLGEDGIPAINFTDPEIANVVDQAAKSFDTNLYPQTASSGLNQNYQISIGNQYMLGNRPFGFIANLSYRRSHSAYDDGFVGRYKNTGTAANPSTSLNSERVLDDVTRATDEVLWGGLIKLSYKPSDKHKISFNYMHNQSGESSVQFLQGAIPEDAPDLFYQTRVMGYTERALDAYQLQGAHVFGKLKFDWIGSMTQSSQEQPDLRFFSTDYTLRQDGDTIFDIQPNLYPAPSRFFRELDEQNLDFKGHFELPFQQWSDLEAKVKFGGAYTTKDRDFAELRYELSSEASTVPYNGDVEAFLSLENTGVVNVDTFQFQGQQFLQYQYGNVYRDASEDRNKYTGTQTISAGYAMIELPIATRLKLVTGARLETTFAETVSGDSAVASGVLDLLDVLPSANLIFNATENMNVRVNYSRTLARPTFREFSPFVSFDFAGDFLLSGNPDLTRTLIDNYDLRWEWFPTLTELFSVSFFYKEFTNPIEKVIPVQAATTEFTYRNIESALVYGTEIEFKKNFAFISPKLEYLTLGGNVSLIQSEVEIPDDIFAKIASVDPFRPQTRPLYGQSPYSLNMELAYVNPVSGTTVSTSFNQFGPRISLVGGINPDVYEQPRGLLNVSFSQRLPKGFSVRVRANNLLNPEYRQTMTYEGVEYDFQRYTVGRSFSIGLSYTVN